VRILFVDDPDGLSRALAAVDAPVVGVDVERADAPRYFRRAALIQIGVPNAVVLIDSVALDPVPGLTAFLAGRTAVLHAIHNDLEPLRAAGVDAGSVEDTAVAAAILGLPIGLDPLLQEVLGVALSARGPPPSTARHRELDVLVDDAPARGAPASRCRRRWQAVPRVGGAEPVDDLLDEHLRCARPRGQTDHVDPVEPGLVDLGGVVDR
jgi:hypothetical protein